MSKKVNIAAGASLFIFAVIAILTVSGRLDALNDFLASATHSIESPALTAVLKIITTISEWFVYAPIAILLFAIPKLRWKAGFPVTATLGISAVLNTLLKHIFAIPRPDDYRLIAETGFGFPSGHAMNGVAFIGICVLLFVRYSESKPRKIAVSVLAIIFMLAVGFSRVYLGVHNPTDVMAGYAMGLCLCFAALSVFEIVRTKRNISIIAPQRN